MTSLSEYVYKLKWMLFRSVGGDAGKAEVSISQWMTDSSYLRRSSIR